MPIYEFCCNACNHVSEQLMFPSDQTVPACPSCGSHNVRKLISSGAVRPNGIPTGSGGFTPPACKTGPGRG
ncbi:zinc ribbon domain-containing protein [Desulfosarcina sp. OttesenSCG-928-B08]|nr:zinc ribbon domain-containing protein [Desulfosarcina sp. OttesenSCG-928-B08]